MASPGRMDRFLEYLNEGSQDECWIWKGPTCKFGNYHVGQLKIDGVIYYAHRLSYEYFFGKVPNVICHRCPDFTNVSKPNSLCCNPKHLHDGSKRDNRLDQLRFGEDTNIKLSDTQVEEILKDYQSRTFKFGDKLKWMKAIAPNYGVGYRYIESIIYNTQRHNKKQSRS
jgi:hypothetical protein